MKKSSWSILFIGLRILLAARLSEEGVEIKIQEELVCLR